MKDKMLRTDGVSDTTADYEPAENGTRAREYIPPGKPPTEYQRSTKQGSETAAAPRLLPSSAKPSNELMNLVQGIFWEAEVPLRFVFVSQQAEAILGYPVSEWLNNPEFWAQHIHPDDRDRILDECDGAVAQLTNHEMTYRMTAADGRTVWLRDIVTVVAEAGKPPKLYGLMVDVTKQKQLESELQQLRQMMQLVMDTIPESIFWKNKDCVLMGCNRVFALQAGLEHPSDVVGKTDYDLPWTKEQRHFCRASDLEVIQEDRPRYHMTESVSQADGTTVWVDTNKMPLHDASGNVIGILGTCQNITEHIEAKAALERTRDELETAVSERTHDLWDANKELSQLTLQLQTARDEAIAASSVKSDFVANISHEMRTPLASIIGTAELLADSCLDEEQVEELQTIRSSADHLLTIINNVLDLSKIEAGKLELESIQFDPLVLLESTVALMSAAAHSKHISLQSFGNTRLPSLVEGDPIRLRQILLNLLANAIKFTGDGGEVFVRCDGEVDSDDIATIRFSVHDTGIGIPLEAQKGLFQPFWQLDKSTTRRYGGTGLGLSISKKLVQVMGGNIGVHSNQDTGSIFWFTVQMPVVTPLEQQSPNTWERARKCIGGKHILLAPTNHHTRQTLTAYLQEADATIDVVTTPTKALDLMRQSRTADAFDVVVVEVNRASEWLPQVAESDLAESLAKKIVLLSADLNDEHRTEPIVVVKPFSRVQLFNAICKTGDFESPDFDRIGKTTDVPTSASPKISSTNKVMLVEDNRVLARLGEQQLSKLGLAVQSVPNGDQALEELAHNDYGLVFMDCQMPGMDGWEATRLIREREKQTGKHIPIVAMTAGAMSGDREKCLLAGMDDYLSKPVRLKDLQRIVEHYLPQAT